MGMERTAMSRKEFDRGAVFARVERRELTLKEAAELLKISYRQARRMYKRYRAEGPAGLVHRSVGCESNRARPGGEREGVLEIVREHYGGTPKRGPGQRFGPTLVAEHLWEDEGEGADFDAAGLDDGGRVVESGPALEAEAEATGAAGAFGRAGTAGRELSRLVRRTR
ncbi:MAG: helix-turn-helix domain-containing protein, partial [Gemmatimonas sp.]|nr:helix-turn-helix domain-containing protein [Gemmatimonas sp.]